MADEIIIPDFQSELAKIKPEEIRPLFQMALAKVRPEIADNPYIIEALRVLPVNGYRSAIGSFWNAVVDDLRNKIMHRSLESFNKALNMNPVAKNYEDFQNRVSDDQLIDGAYLIGVIGWEASKILKHAKETRHIFSGHPKSSDPSVLKVLVMMEDCIKYVLNEPYPVQIINIDDYIAIMDTAHFDRNLVTTSNTLSEIPEIYKNTLINRLFTVYIDPRASSTMRSNIEFVAPILWKLLPKEIKTQIVRRVDTEIAKGNSAITKFAFDFVNLVGANSYLSLTAREHLIAPIINELKGGLSNWTIPDRCMPLLSPYAAQIPPGLIEDYVMAITLVYVGWTGYSRQFSRTNFYADHGAPYVPDMFGVFDDAAIDAFITTLKTNTMLRSRIENPTKLDRLRSLGNIALNKASAHHAGRDILMKLVDPAREGEFWEAIK